MVDPAPAGDGLSPQGWEGEQLILLESPTARAWVAPSHGGGVVAFEIATAGGWRQVLYAGSADAVRERPTRFGCPVLFPFPGLVRDAAYWWEGRQYQLPLNAPDGTSFAHGFAHDRPWTVVEREEHRVLLRFETPGLLTAHEREGYPFAVSLRQEMSLEANRLSIELVARNQGDDLAPVGLGLHPYVAMSFLGGERSGVVVDLPEGVTGGQIRLRSDGQELHTRSGMPSSGKVRMAGTQGEVVLHLAHAVHDLAAFAPEDGQSVSLEPTSCPLSAGSLLTEAGATSQSGLRLAPREELRVAICIAVRDLEPMDSARR